MKNSLNILILLDKMRKGEELKKEEVYGFVKAVMDKTIADYQITAFLMAASIHGMSEEVVFWFTDALANSGQVYDLKEEKESGLIVIDKHSSGGVGDKMTLTLAPLLACAGLTLIKVSGRGFSFSGGTIDKIESMGMKTTLSIEEIRECVKRSNIAVFAPSKYCAPADATLYALRDVTATADSLTLTASSIMAWKLPFGSEYSFLDVKYGSGSFFKDYKDSCELARIMTAIGRAAGKKMFAQISSMQQPLGGAVGNTIEVLEVQNFFKGQEVAEHYKELVYHFVGQIYVTTEKAKDLEDAKQKIIGYVKDGSALKAMEKWIESQGGNVEAFRNQTYFNPAHKKDVLAPSSGYFGIIDNSQIGYLSCRLGAGRTKALGEIDYQAGIYVHKKINDMVNEGDVLYTLYSSNPICDSIVKDILDNTSITTQQHLQDQLFHLYCKA